MTPHEKAKDIYQKMFDNMPHPNETNAAVFLITKQCALIAVDEMLTWFKAHSYSNKNYDAFVFYNEVKQEIEKL